MHGKIVLIKKAFNILINLVLVSLVVSAGWKWWTGRQVASSLEGTRPGDMRLYDIQGVAKTINGEQSGPYVIVFWATWCSPCTLELGRLQAAVKDGELNGAQIMAIAVNEPIEQVAQEVQAQSYTFSVYVDPEGKIAKKFKLAATPTLAYMSPFGEIQRLESGITPFLVSGVADHLKGD